ncbi:MAG: CatB-related O-acetyltransferase [Actinomycetota bacterium]
MHPWQTLRERLRLRAVAFLRRSLGPTDKQRLAEWIASGNVEIGRHSYGIPRIVSHVGDKGEVRIGAFCSIADDVEIFLGGNHRADWISTFPFRSRFGLEGAYADGHPSSKGVVNIGNDVWIGRGACILSGVTIGNGAVIGAHAVVARDVRSYAVVVGNPAREIRRRFSDDQIRALEEIAWWDWPDAKIVDEVARLSSSHVDVLIEHFSTARQPTPDDHPG